MTIGRSRAVAWCGGTVIVLALPVILLVEAGAGEHGYKTVEIVWNYSALLMFLAVGLTLALNVPRNPIGWILVVLAAAMTFDGSVGAYAGYSINHDAHLPGARVAAAWAHSWVPVWFALLGAILFLLPDGRLPSRRWRPVAFAGIAATALALSGGLLGNEQRIEALEEIEPFGVLPPSITEVMFAVGMTGMAVVLVLIVLAMVIRYRHATREVRAQLKWIAYAAVLFPVALVVWVIESAVTEYSPAVVTNVVAGLAVAGFCGAIAISVLRYRLYDIDVVINRTLVYGTLTVIVVAGYVGLVGGLDALLGSRGWAGVIAAGTVAVGVQPLRERLQRGADRWLYGYRSDPYQALHLLGDRLQAALAPDQVLQTIVGSVAEALRVPYVAVTFTRDGEAETAAAHGTLGRATPERRPLLYRDVVVAELVVGVPAGRELTAADHRLLDDLAVQAGVAVHAVRLTADLQHSRERLVTAREEERRRVRRDLHDGLGPTLAAAVLDLDSSRRAVVDDPVRAEQLLVDLRGQMQDAIADVRRLVYELRPPALDQLGLVGALRAHAARICDPNGGLKVGVDAPEALPVLPAAVEVAAYRIAMEAINNVQRHAQAKRCTVQLDLHDCLELEIADDGKGLAATTESGVGMQSMRERARELGGTLTIDDREGGGTRVMARIPVGGAS
jgi:two-component system, NarL family, sensor kinase